MSGKILRAAVGYDTPLTAAQQPQYDQWRGSLPHDLQNTADYDLQGAYLNGSQATGRAHMTDQFKKPNHMTFSDGSQYSTPQMPGGHWAGSDKDGWAFWASLANMQQHPIAEMGQYFNQAEPGSTFVAPYNYSLPRR